MRNVGIGLWVFGLGLGLGGAGCQSSDQTGSGVVANPPPVGSETPASKSAVKSAPAPLLRVAFGHIDAANGIGRPPKEPRKRVATFAIAGGTYASKSRVRVPDHERILLVLENSSQPAVDSAELNWTAGENSVSNVTYFERDADGSLVLALDERAIAEGMQSKDGVFRAQIEMRRDGSTTKETHGLVLPLSMALPAFQVQTFGTFYGQSYPRVPGLLGRDATAGLLFAEDFSITNPSAVPLKLFFRLTSRGDFRQVTRVSWAPNGGYSAPEKLAGHDPCGKSSASSASQFSRAYLTASLQLEKLRLKREMPGQPAETVDYPVPNDWWTLSLAPKETLSLAYGVKTSAQEYQPWRSIGCKFTGPAQFPGSPAYQLDTFNDALLRGSIGRVIVATVLPVDTVRVEAVIGGEAKFAEEGRVLTDQGPLSSGLKNLAEFEAPVRGTMTREEWAHPTPLFSTEPFVGLATTF